MRWQAIPRRRRQPSVVSAACPSRLADITIGAGPSPVQTFPTSTSPRTRQPGPHADARSACQRASRSALPRRRSSSVCASSGTAEVLCPERSLVRELSSYPGDCSSGTRRSPTAQHARAWQDTFIPRVVGPRRCPTRLRAPKRRLPGLVPQGASRPRPFSRPVRMESSATKRRGCLSWEGFPSGQAITGANALDELCGVDSAGHVLLGVGAGLRRTVRPSISPL